MHINNNIRRTVDVFCNSLDTIVYVDKRFYITATFSRWDFYSILPDKFVYMKKTAPYADAAIKYKSWFKESMRRISETCIVRWRCQSHKIFRRYGEGDGTFGGDKLYALMDVFLHGSLYVRRIALGKKDWIVDASGYEHIVSDKFYGISDIVFRIHMEYFKTGFGDIHKPVWYVSAGVKYYRSVFLKRWSGPLMNGHNKFFVDHRAAQKHDKFQAG